MSDFSSTQIMHYFCVPSTAFFVTKSTHYLSQKMREFSDEFKRSFQYITKVLDLIMFLRLTNHEHAPPSVNGVLNKHYE